MGARFFIWASVLVVSLVATGLGIRILAVQEVPVGESLALRGLGCLVLVVFFARRKSLSLFPKSPRTQLVRAFVAGLALTLFSLSYNWLTASTVSVLSNIDVSMLLILGPLIGVNASRRSRILSVLSIFFLVWYVVGLEEQANLIYGLSFLGLGTLLLCFGYFFIKKSMNEENEAITILVPSLAILFYGVAESAGRVSPTWTPWLVVVCGVSAIGMFGAYYATMKLYAVTDLASAEFPSLLSSIVIQPVEGLLESEPLRASFLLSSIGFVAITYFILKEQNRSPELSNA